ncbi:hypothetical protein CCICO_08850 [Corynebacterium ciconiae DSM 44920]|uniref:TIGR02569 family protein n=1 Tax=Corynebacterium ciconiae TaxID=227319 RepID=UPI0003622930|nr:TIGR02569 family protein [Corynebacterium ciconiae]WKD61778.1 hypothetical protein CCICO_08850 [Corynebacterium ciconiae DSM 44920]
MTDTTDSTPVGSVPGHVFEAFRVPTHHIAASSRLGSAWDNGIKCGNVVISRASSASFAAWSAKLRESLHPTGVRLVRPVRSTDGRVVISGFRANAFVVGEPAQRVDETVSAALRLADALAEVRVPQWVNRDVPRIDGEASIFHLADRAAWSDQPAELLARAFDGNREAHGHEVEALTAAAELHSRVPDIPLETQLGHADMLGTTIFSGSQAPIVTEIVPVAHPHAYTAALTMVDGIIADAVDIGVLDRFSHLRYLDALAARGVLYRLYVHALHPATRPAHSRRIVALAREIGERLDADS